MGDSIHVGIEVETASRSEAAKVTQEVRDWVNNMSRDCRASMEEVGESPEGGKAMGAGLEILGLTVSLFQTGAIANLVNCLATYLRERRRKVSFTVTSASGQTVTLDSENLGRDEVSQLVEQLKDIAAGEE